MQGVRWWVLQGDGDGQAGALAKRAEDQLLAGRVNWLTSIREWQVQFSAGCQATVAIHQHILHSAALAVKVVPISARQICFPLSASQGTMAALPISGT